MTKFPIDEFFTESIDLELPQVRFHIVVMSGDIKFQV